jgi:hypothetical protein
VAASSVAWKKHLYYVRFQVLTAAIMIIIMIIMVIIADDGGSTHL